VGKVCFQMRDGNGEGWQQLRVHRAELTSFFFPYMPPQSVNSNTHLLSQKKNKKRKNPPHDGVDSGRSHLSVERKGGGKCHGWCVESVSRSGGRVEEDGVRANSNFKLAPVFEGNLRGSTKQRHTARIELYCSVRRPFSNSRCNGWPTGMSEACQCLNRASSTTPYY
jgi:hypothetical protein